MEGIRLSIKIIDTADQHPEGFQEGCLVRLSVGQEKLLRSRSLHLHLGERKVGGNDPAHFLLQLRQCLVVKFMNRSPSILERLFLTYCAIQSARQ